MFRALVGSLFDADSFGSQCRDPTSPAQTEERMEIRDTLPKTRLKGHAILLEEQCGMALGLFQRNKLTKTKFQRRDSFRSGKNRAEARRQRTNNLGATRFQRGFKEPELKWIAKQNLGRIKASSKPSLTLLRASSLLSVPHPSSASFHRFAGQLSTHILPRRS